MDIARTKIRLLTIFIILFFITFIIYCGVLIEFPQNLMLIKGKEYIYKFNAPMSIGITVDKSSSIKLNGSRIGSNDKIKLNSAFKLQSDQIGKVNLELKLFGKIPFKTVTVNVVPEAMVKPCGNTIGVKILTKGILVVGVSSIKGVDGKDYRPCADIEEGDIILSVNGKNLESVKQFADVIQSFDGSPLELEIERNSEIINFSILPIKTEDKYRMGLWVRDSTSGIGTLTFCDANTNKFGALGHGITDVDTGSLLTVNKGDILQSSIITVDKGKKGSPGELKGIFLNEDFKLGNIIENNEYGIYGQITSSESLPNNAVIPIALRNEIKEGSAVILSNIDGTNVESYTIDIQKILLNNYHNSKSMVIKVTDPKLIQTTGGIVQGMSGSPIIQNGKLVGAVTHVFVNDPTRGYAIFSELMMENINKIK